jgi:hypothetical protein
MFLTYIAVVAIAAFIPYVAAPGIATGVKSLESPPAATSPEVTPSTPVPAPAAAGDAGNRVVRERRDIGSVG